MVSNPIRDAHIRLAEILILSYTGDVPFATYLKKYFAVHKKHGSRDRKQIAALCYGFFRLGSGADIQQDTRQRIALGHFLTQSVAESSETPEDNLKSRLLQVQDQFDATRIFPFNQYLSPTIDTTLFNRSFLLQPHLYIRIRRNFENTVVRKLEQSEIPFRKINSHCIETGNATQLQHVLKIDKEAVIQDYNSQQVATLFDTTGFPPGRPLHIWDCCAASGGKAILATDHYQNAVLTVTDKRKSILRNLKKRFVAAGIQNYYESVTDLSLPVHDVPGTPFDLIIADVPCSGSGTWARTPEQLSFFREGKIGEYAHMQRSVVSNAVKHLKPGGFLLYITCSVFREENEDNIAKITQATGLKLIAQQYFNGYAMQADTLFGAVMQAS